MAVPNIFATATSSIPLSQLDTNFATAITLGSTGLYLGNTTTSVAGLTLTGSAFNGTVGATTPSTGAFTTVTTTTSVAVGGSTLSGSGSGVQFPATQSASTDANTLDDYEEGTWTPVLADAGSGGNTFTMVVQNGLYTKIGNVVTVYYRVTWSSKGSASGVIRLRGFPFASKATSGGYYYMGSTGNTNGQITLALEGGSSAAIFLDSTSNAGNDTEFSASDTGIAINGSLTYLT